MKNILEKNILIADDEEQIHKLLVDMLQGHGYRFFSAFNGKEAVKIANNHPIDLAILDMVMPELDGFETLKQIKAIDKTIEVLIITGYGDMDNLRQMMVDHGAFDYLLKPFNTFEIVNTVQRAICKRELIVRNDYPREEFERHILELEWDFKIKTFQLRESQIKYKNIVQNSNDIIVVLQDGHIKFANSRTMELTGYTREEIFNTPFIEKIHPGDRDLVMENHRKRLEGKAFPPYTFRILKQDGRVLWVEVNSQKTLWKGKPATLNIIRDNTERKLAEDALQESEERFRMIFDGSRDAILATGPDAGIVEVNKAAAALTGYAVEELKKMSISDLLVDEDRSLLKVYFHRIMAGEKVTFEAKILRKDGAGVSTEFSNQRFTIKDDYYMHIVARDIRERKQASEALARRVSFEKMIGDISGRAIIVDDINNFLDECLEIMGKTLDVSRIYIFEHYHDTKTMDNTYEWVASGVTPQKERLQEVSAGDAPWWMETMKNHQTINYKDIEDIPSESEKEILRAQSIKSILVVPLFVENKYYGFMGFDECRYHRDWLDEDINVLITISQIITSVISRKKFEEFMRQSEKLSSIGQLTAGIAHELRNPITIISSCAQFCLEDQHNSSQMDENLRLIYASSRRANDLIQELLTFAKPSTPEWKMVNVNRVVSRMLDMAKLEAKPLQTVFRKNLDKQLPKIIGDEEKLSQVFLNIIMNAVQAVSDNGEIVVQTRCLSDEAHVEACIIDNGIGISDECRHMIFDPFFTTKDSGTGLGLSICHTIIQQHKGSISAESKARCGTKIYVRLPLRQERAFS